MKAIMLAAQSIALGENDIVLAGGMESMSNVPYYLDKARNGYRLGNGQIIDGLVKDGLWDVYNDYHMGSAAELVPQIVISAVRSRMLMLSNRTKERKKHKAKASLLMK